MYLRIRLEDGDVTAFSGKPDQEDLQGVDEGNFALIKFENNSYFVAEATFNEPEEGEEDEEGEWEVTWAKVGGV